MGQDTVFNQEGANLFTAPTRVVERWLLDMRSPESLKNYTVLCEGIKEPVSAEKYLEIAKEHTLSHIDDGIESEELVHRWTLMNPKDEILLWSDELRNDMVVVTEDMEKRYDIIVDMHPFQESMVLIFNRFCTVSKLETHDDGSITFVGVYSDGVQITRRGDRRDGWIVKKDSLPPKSSESEESIPTYRISPLKTNDGKRWIQKTNLETGEITYHEMTEPSTDENGDNFCSTTCRCDPESKTRTDNGFDSAFDIASWGD